MIDQKGSLVIYGFVHIRRERSKWKSSLSMALFYDIIEQSQGRTSSQCPAGGMLGIDQSSVAMRLENRASMDDVVQLMETTTSAIQRKKDSFMATASPLKDNTLLVSWSIPTGQTRYSADGQTTEGHSTTAQQKKKGIVLAPETLFC